MSRVSLRVRRFVADRAKQRCEYCRTSERVTGQLCVVDHIIPVSRGGSDLLDNLGLCCGWCNSFKQSRVFGFDEKTKQEVRLFHPRRDRWSHHFRWSRDRTRIMAITAIGRVTVELLRLNRPVLIEAREFWNRNRKR